MSIEEKIKSLYNKLDGLEKSFSDPDNELLILSEEISKDCLDKTASMLTYIKSQISERKKEIESWIGQISLQKENGNDGIIDDLEKTTELANKLDESDDPELQQHAQVLDRFIFRMAEGSNFEALKEKYRQRNFDSNYIQPREELKKSFRIEETKKALDEKKIKNFRPMEAPLLTRSCPEHPGVNFKRVDDSVYQCPLDNKIYDFKEGYTTLKGNKIPGGAVSNQWNDSPQHHGGQMGFETRESKTK